MLLTCFKFVFYILGLQVNFKGFPKNWNLICLFAPCISMYLILFVYNTTTVDGVESVSHFINLSVTSIHQVFYVLILLETYQKSNYEKLLDIKIEKIDELITTHFNGVSDMQEANKSLSLKRHIVPIILTTSLIAIAYCFILYYTRFLSDWTLSLMPRIVFHFFCINMIIQWDVVQKRIRLVRQHLEEFNTENEKSMINSLEDIYIEIWELAQLINYKFQISIGIVLLQQYLDLTICSFWTLEYVKALHSSFICKY